MKHDFTQDDVRWHRTLARQQNERVVEIRRMSMYRDIRNRLTHGSDAQLMSNAEATRDWHNSMADRIERLLSDS